MIRQTMAEKILIAVILTVSLAGVLTGCGGENDAETVQVAEGIGLESCILCSMTVADQPAPRAQVVHRDGYRVFLCAASELGPYLSVPSSHGKPSTVFVEVLLAGDDGSQLANGVHDWADAATATYVVDGPSRPVMGAPILSFRNEREAAEVAAEVNGTVVAWEGLLSFLQPN